MRKISFWAKHHVTAARFYIILIKLVLAVLSYYVGISLYKMQLVIPHQPVYIVSVLFLITAVLIYPAAKKETVIIRWHYLRHKTADLLLPLGAVLIFTTWINNAGTININNPAYGSHIIKHPAAQEILNSGKTKETLTRLEKRILKKEFYKQLKVYSIASISGDKAKAGEAWKILLAIIGMVGLLFLLASLVCSLSCSGSDAAAVIVGVLGLVGIIWGFAALVKRIKRGPKTGVKTKGE